MESSDSAPPARSLHAEAERTLQAPQRPRPGGMGRPRRWAVSDAPISSVATGRPNQLRPRVQEAGPDVAIDRREERGSLP